jgi:transposase
LTSTGEIVGQLAAIEVAKASGWSVPGCRMPPGRAGASQGLAGPSTTKQILELAEQLAGEGIERVVVESTSEDWRPLVSVLEARGLVVWLVNAGDVKHLPGPPKTDKLDAVWWSKPQPAGHAGALGRPAAQIRRLREDTGLGADLTADRTRHTQRLEQAAGWTP